MKDDVISFIDCYQELQENQISVMPAPVESGSITVKNGFQTVYTYLAKAANRITRWITITADFFSGSVKKIAKFISPHSIHITGIQILHKFSVLRI